MRVITRRPSRHGFVSIPATRLEPVTAPDLETSEFRMFSAGSLPAEMQRWVQDWPGEIERRCDVYFVGDRVDVGLKRRGGTTMELKTRWAVTQRMVLAPGLIGRLETWQKWSAADELGALGATARTCVDVDKQIVRRRFTLDGGESVYRSGSVPEGSGCDVEVVIVQIGSETAWSLALTAFGPRDERPDELRAAWSAVGATDTVSALVRTGRSMGYPEWLSLGPIGHRCGRAIVAMGTSQRACRAR